MLKTFRYLFFLIILTIHAETNCQETNTFGIKVIARPTSDSILLRWAPVNYESWKKGMETGYIVERYTLIENGRIPDNRNRIILTQRPVKQQQEQVWQKLYDQDKYAAIAAQAIFGKDFELQAQGSAAINIFNRATVQQNRYSFAMFAADQSPRVARAMGLWFTDTKVKRGEKYLYRVYYACSGCKADTAYVFTGTDEIIPLQKPVFGPVEGNDKNIALSWKGPGGRNSYSSFDLQRSVDGGKNFVTLNTSPLINTFENASETESNFYMDTVANPGSRYIYRVRGTTSFGETGPYSDTISVVAHETLKENPQITKHHTTPQGVFLEWSLSEKSQNLIKEYRVLRSTESNRNFEPVSVGLGNHIQKFTDGKPLSTAYYIVEATGTLGEKVLSFPVLVQLIDSIPPAPPVQLFASADTTGKVILKWPANQEKDIYGYRIYRANAANEEFSQITVNPVRDTVYIDSIQLKTLTKHIYYKLMAIDQRQNHSELSETFEVKRPDIVPPAAPVIIKTESTVNGIFLEWIPSKSEDVAEQRVIRRIPDGAWEIIKILPKIVTNFCDSLAQDEVLYEYALQAKDESGLNSSIVQIMKGKKISGKYSLQLTGTVNRQKLHIQLNWNNPANNGKFTLYRGENGKTLVTYKVLEGNQISFTDIKVKPSTTYNYLLKYVDDNNLITSQELVINY